MSAVILAGTGRGVLELKEENDAWTIGQRRFMPEWEIKQS